LSNKSDRIAPLVNRRSVDTAQNLVANNKRPGTKEIKQVSTKELEAFIETIETDAPKESAKQPKNAGKVNVEELLKDVSTSEMERFLSAIPTADDEFLITD
jgi:hypothetical protein